MIYQKTKAKEIVYEKEKLSEIIFKSMDIQASIIGRTLGPGGNPILIERDDMPPFVTKDGATVAKFLGVNDAKQNVIIEVAKEICLNTAVQAGDGTTTAIILANSLLNEEIGRAHV